MDTQDPQASPASVQDALRRWRQTHPQASFAEIERAVEAEIGKLRAALVQELAGEEAAEIVWCPTCGGRMMPRGRGRRTVTMQGDEPVTLDRRYLLCPACTVGVFPPR
jgi:DNA-directed RNA polymerase subunit RPC12/RpoP